jgi:hypothetical protein
MNSLRFLLGVAALLVLCGISRGQDGSAAPAPGSGPGLGQVLQDLGRSSAPATTPTAPANAPLSRGLGQVVSGWTHDGVHGQQLAQRIHWLQSTRTDERSVSSRGFERQRPVAPSEFGRGRDQGSERDRVVDSQRRPEDPAAQIGAQASQTDARARAKDPRDMKKNTPEVKEDRRPFPNVRNFFRSRFGGTGH